MNHSGVGPGTWVERETSDFSSPHWGFRAGAGVEGGRSDCENGGKDAFYWCFVVTQLKRTDTKTSAEHGSRANRRWSAGPAGCLYQQVHLRSLSFIWGGCLLPERSRQPRVLYPPGPEAAGTRCPTVVESPDCPWKSSGVRGTGQVEPQCGTQCWVKWQECLFVSRFLFAFYNSDIYVHIYIYFCFL